MNEEFMAEVLRADVISVVLLVLVLVVVAVLAGLGVFGVVTWRVLSVSSSVVKANGGMMENLNKQTVHLSRQTDYLQSQTAQLESMATATRESRLVLGQVAEQVRAQATLRDDLLEALAHNRRDVLDEFKPVVDKLSAIGVGVDALNQAIAAHRQSEARMLTILRREQTRLGVSLEATERTLKQIFERVVEEERGKNHEDVTRFNDDDDFVLIGVADGGDGAK